MLDNIPLYKAQITDELEGLTAVSLVEYPAVESNFLAFEKDEKRLLFNIEDEEKRLVVGCLMRCDFPIYRRDLSGYEYFIVYDKQTIEIMAEKALKEGFINNINLNHDDNNFVEGVTLREIYIKDTEKGINPKGFDDISNGSLFATYHIENNDVWEQIKNGTFKGYSLEGYFSIKEELFTKQSKEELLIDECIDLITQIKNK